jgi:ADP-ribose pyrophosphatase YjhB (NUDIX family)
MALRPGMALRRGRWAVVPAGCGRRGFATTASALPWEPARFRGASLTVDGPVDEQFEERLSLALGELRADGRKGVWLRVPIEHSAACAVAARHGFVYHHAEGSESMLLHWMPESQEPCPVPSFATHIVGVGGLVLNRSGEVLCVREAQSHRATSWKLPGGLMDLGEEVGDAAAREVFEETGVRTTFQSLLTMRVQHGAAFGRDDFYFVAAMAPATDEETIRIDATEISECAWLPLEEYVAGTEASAAERGVGDTMNSWLMRNLSAQLAAGVAPAQLGWETFQLDAGTAQSNQKVTGWGSRPTFNIFGPSCFFQGRPAP